MRFQTKLKSRVDGFVLALAWLAISHASCARLRVTDKITPLTTNQKKSYCRVFDRFLKQGHNSESTGRDIFWRRKAPCECRRLELPNGIWGHAPPNRFLKQNTQVSGVSGTRESVSQTRLVFTEILRNDDLNNYCKANQHLNLTLTRYRNIFLRLGKSMIL